MSLIKMHLQAVKDDQYLNMKAAQRIVDVIKPLFYGGNHPNEVEIRNLVNAFAETKEYKLSDPAWVNTTVQELWEEFN